MQQIHRVLLFILIVLSVFVLSGNALFRQLYRKRAFSNFEKILFTLSIVGLLCIGYAFFVEPYWPETVHIQIPIAKLQKGQSVRIIHISDVHSDTKPRLEERLPEIIRQNNPDLIVFTGDSLNSADGLVVFQKLMSQLADIAPVYAVKGNWDSWYWKNLNPLSIEKVHELDCQIEAIKIRDTEVRMGGIGVGNESCASNLFAHFPKNQISIFLYHYPDLIPEVSESRKIDLYLAGHTHGGQVRMPFYGALITFSKFDKKYESGLYKENETYLYVNRGIGMEGGNAPRIRFLARPEITVIDLVPN